MLLAVDSGRLHEFKGHNLKSINVDGIRKIVFFCVVVLTSPVNFVDITDVCCNFQRNTA